MTKNKRDGFRTFTGCFTCGMCGKKTRETNETQGTKLCRSCYDDAGAENNHNDNHGGPVRNEMDAQDRNNCPLCKAEK